MPGPDRGHERSIRFTSERILSATGRFLPRPPVTPGHPQLDDYTLPGDMIGAVRFHRPFHRLCHHLQPSQPRRMFAFLLKPLG